MTKQFSNLASEKKHQYRHFSPVRQRKNLGSESEFDGSGSATLLEEERGQVADYGN